MICKACQNVFSETDLDPEIGGGNGDAIEMKFACPTCKQGYYTFVPLADFTLDPDKPGNPEAEA